MDGIFGPTRVVETHYDEILERFDNVENEIKQVVTKKDVLCSTVIDEDTESIVLEHPVTEYDFIEIQTDAQYYLTGTASVSTIVSSEVFMKTNGVGIHRISPIYVADQELQLEEAGLVYDGMVIKASDDTGINFEIAHKNKWVIAGDAEIADHTSSDVIIRKIVGIKFGQIPEDSEDA